MIKYRKVNSDLAHGRLLSIETHDREDGDYSDHIAFGNLQIEY